MTAHSHQFIVNEKGEKVSVIISIEEYEILIADNKSIIKSNKNLKKFRGILKKQNTEDIDKELNELRDSWDNVYI